MMRPNKIGSLTAHEPVVYFMQRSDGLIKIGTTQDLFKRKASLETGTGPLEILGRILGSYDEESMLHERFAVDWVYGEWFNPSDDLKAFIKSTTRTSD